MIDRQIGDVSPYRRPAPHQPAAFKGNYFLGDESAFQIPPNHMHDFTFMPVSLGAHVPQVKLAASIHLKNRVAQGIPDIRHEFLNGLPLASLGVVNRRKHTDMLGPLAAAREPHHNHPVLIQPSQERRVRHGITIQGRDQEMIMQEEGFNTIIQWGPREKWRARPAILLMEPGRLKFLSSPILRRLRRKRGRCFDATPVAARPFLKINEAGLARSPPGGLLRDVSIKGGGSRRASNG